MRALLLLVVLLASCARPPAFAVVEPFSAEEHVSLARAASKWNAVTHRPISLEGGPWRIVRQPPPVATHIGETTTAQHLIVIAPGLDDATFYSCALHEFGHSLGLNHITGSGVMNPVVGATEFSAEDLTECRRAGACD